MDLQGIITRLRRPLLTLGVAALAAGTAAGPAAAAHHGTMPSPTTYTFTTLDNNADPTFNQLLGINDQGLISGYFGSGQANHPNKGYTLTAPFGQANYANENFPGSAQTQVTGLNNRGVTVGFWADAAGDNFGFYLRHGVYHTVVFPTTYGATVVNQMLGVNDRNVAVGFYTDANGNNHGFTYDVRMDRFAEVVVPGFTNVTAAGINDRGEVTGFGTDTATGKTEAFLLHRGQVTVLAAMGATSTQALGVNNRDEVVGDYVDAQQQMHGFTWTPNHGFQTVDDPHGIGTTTINGLNDRGQLVGFYVDSAGNTDGLLAQPQL
jgi:hypothetical protein